MNTSKQWQFWVDRGGTFTDIVAISPQQTLHTKKLLSHNPTHYDDAIIEGIRRFLKTSANQKLAINQIASIKIGTTVATNALLERKGAKTVWLTTKGFKDALAIGYQNRKNLFSLTEKPYDGLYAQVIEVEQRMNAKGDIIQALNMGDLLTQLQKCLAQGYQSVAISFCHALKNPQHENELFEAIRHLGFKNISLSHRSSMLEKFISRSSTTLTDAYLAPVLAHYIDSVLQQFDKPSELAIEFMQSHGGLCKPQHFGAKNAILSGPAGGVVGMVKTAQQAGYQALIGFDMGGTSTDVCHYLDDYEYTQETELNDYFVAVPMLSVHTVAAGGGSILSFDGQRLRVGPESAGATPGPCCYRNNGPLTITDCHVLLGRIQPEYFPKVFGQQANQGIDRLAVSQAFQQLTEQINQNTAKQFNAEQIAEGYLDIASEAMAEAIKKITVQKGYDTKHYTLCCFGGAGGQMACKVAEKLSIKRIFLHHCSGVLSALGMGLAETKLIKSCLVKKTLQDVEIRFLNKKLDLLKQEMLAELDLDNEAKVVIKIQALMHYHRSNTKISVEYKNINSLALDFTQAHQQQFGFELAVPIILDSLQVEMAHVLQSEALESLDFSQLQDKTIKDSQHTQEKIFVNGQWVSASIFAKNTLHQGDVIVGPAIIVEDTATTVIESHWQAEITESGIEMLQLTQQQHVQSVNSVDPIRLEIFNHLLMALAEQMGVVLEKTAASVNIKERKDFSCALFDAQGHLVANAPHVPVHLGSMSDSVQALINKAKHKLFKHGEAYILNNPYAGGTHLPDITVIMPVFSKQQENPVAFVAARGHHADIGGITPGSMPANSSHISQEGILFDNDLLLKNNELQLSYIQEKLSASDYPARNIAQNIEDLKAQVASCQRGQQVFAQLEASYSLKTLQLYMQAIQDNAAQAIRTLIDSLSSGHYRIQNDLGIIIDCNIRINNSDSHKPITIDFSDSSQQLNDSNWNAPSSITTAAVLYVFRCLIDDDIPLNQGCLRLIEIKLARASVLSPIFPAAVVAGNVETSQLIVDCLFAALGVCAASQGTMNNIIFGNEQYQYYETLAGGSGASIKGDGINAKQTHMTNSRITDVEVLEQRFPVLVDEFCIRQNCGGDGQFRGGDGVTRRLQFLQDMQVNLISGQRQKHPQGINGGGQGQKGENSLIDENLKSLVLSANCSVTIKKGQKLQIKTPSGGGFGKKQ